MATFTVTTNADVVASDGRLSLREAVARANATAETDRIDFAATLEGKTLVLTGGQLEVTDDLRVDGDRDNDGGEVTLSGGGDSRVLLIAGTGTDASLRDLAVTGGYAYSSEHGGSILLGAGNGLALTDCTVSGNRAGNGAGIAASDDSRLTLTDCTVSRNFAPASGGGIEAHAGSRLTVVGSSIRDNLSDYGAGGISAGGTGSAAVMIADSRLDSNSSNEGVSGISLYGGSLVLARSTVSDNSTFVGLTGSIAASGHVSVSDSTIGGNTTSYQGVGGISFGAGTLIVRNSTVTGNLAHGPEDNLVGGGIVVQPSTRLDIANSVVAGNFIQSETPGAVPRASDILGTIALSNGHNVFGSAVTGDIAGDRENVAPSALFAAPDPATGGGLLNASGVAPLRDNVANPALSAADPLAALRTDQLGAARPQPPVSLPDLGAAERDQTSLSTNPSANNDVLGV